MEASKLAILLTLAVAAAMASPSQAQNSPQDYVRLHNAARAAVGVGPVTWDSSVQAFAENYARQRAGDCSLIHSNNRVNLGENLFWGGAGKDWTAADAVNLWVNERSDYNYGSNSCAQGKVCGHYTQVVWSTSTSIGCARVVCNGGRGVFITCNYRPAGNIVGQKPY
uniref:SCP domain-containing protein n=1 Tax=Leersia perrieri TaxID=77586 RepID=A0A0D9V168_9ORYZ